MENKKISTLLAVMAIVGMAAPAMFATLAILRICNVISWPWWLITLPLWATTLTVLSVVAAYTLIMFVARSVIYPKSYRKKGGDI